MRPRHRLSGAEPLRDVQPIGAVRRRHRPLEEGPTDPPPAKKAVLREPSREVPPSRSGSSWRSQTAAIGPRIRLKPEVHRFSCILKPVGAQKYSSPQQKLRRESLGEMPTATSSTTPAARSSDFYGGSGAVVDDVVGRTGNSAADRLVSDGGKLTCRQDGDVWVSG